MGMQLIETIEVGSGGASSIEFTGIPQDGVDLVLKVSGRANAGTGATSTLLLAINGVTSGSDKVLQGNGSTASSLSNQGYISIYNGTSSTSNTFASIEFHLPNYTSSATKTASADAVTENNATEANQVIAAISRSTTDPITGIIVYSFGAFAINSTASLYKITAD
jgi:hypothetical protein